MWKDMSFHYFVIPSYDMVYDMVKTKSKNALCFRAFSLLTQRVYSYAFLCLWSREAPMCQDCDIQVSSVIGSLRNNEGEEISNGQCNVCMWAGSWRVQRDCGPFRQESRQHHPAPSLRGSAHDPPGQYMSRCLISPACVSVGIALFSASQKGAIGLDG